MTTPARRWLTIAQAAAVAGRSVRTVERWVADGRLAAVAVGGARYVNELALLHAERGTRRASRAGRSGARPRADLTPGVVLSPQSDLRSAHDRTR